MSDKLSVRYKSDRRKQLVEQLNSEEGSITEGIHKLLDITESARPIAEAEDKKILDVLETALEEYSADPVLENYNPDADPDAYSLSRPVLREVAQEQKRGKEFKINSEHVEPDELPGKIDEYCQILAAIIRYDRDEVGFKTDIEPYVKEFLGKSRYYLDSGEGCVDIPTKIWNLFYYCDGRHTNKESLDKAVNRQYSKYLSSIEEDGTHAEVAISEALNQTNGINPELLTEETAQLVRKTLEEATEELGRDSEPDWGMVQ